MAYPALFHITYLDPSNLVTGGCRHGSGSVGDADALPYQPRVVLISENKVTAVGNPPVPNGVAVRAAGRGALTHTAFAWVRDALVVAYWGDMDTDGLEISNEFRVVGIAATSLLMDLDAFDEWVLTVRTRSPRASPSSLAPASGRPRDGRRG